MSDDDAEVILRLGQRVRQMRQGKGWTQDRLAAEAGIHRNYLGGVERGERNPTITSVARIARALNVPVARLLDEPDHD